MAKLDHTAPTRFRAPTVPISTCFTVVFHERRRAFQGAC